MGIDLAMGKERRGTSRAKPLPTDYIGNAFECRIVISAHNIANDIERTVHELLLENGLSQIGTSDNTKRVVTSTLYHDYPYIIAHRMRENQGAVELRVTYNKNDPDEFGQWIGRLESNAKPIAGISFRVTMQVDESPNG